MQQLDDLTLGERIHVARMRARMQQTELADALGVSRPQVSKWERDGSRPDLSQKIRLARVLDQPLEMFCDDDDLIDLRTAIAVGITTPKTTREQRKRQSRCIAASEQYDPEPALGIKALVPA